ncbi:MAG: tyrosine-type recombinase/integrase [Candidatus Lokiarchaeota archaeon]|nr:tyrosine-type recombinase/integrase [Candidatus Lokiarchaeota archaeon]
MIDIKLTKELESFFYKDVQTHSKNTQETKLLALQQFFGVIGPKDTKDMTDKDIIAYINSDVFKTLKNSSKNTKIAYINTFLKHFGREDLAEQFQRYSTKGKEINKNELISRDDLEKILKSAGKIKYKTLIMVLYESACRRNELINIKWKHIKYHENYTNLWIEVSKSKARNIPLVEATPFLQEYFNSKNYPKNQEYIEEKLFGYADSYVNQLLKKIERKTKKRFPSFKKSLNPHLFRHSRLTELATNRNLNEPQLRKFAGWSKNSDMPAIYFHLDDSDLRNELIGEEKKKQEIEIKKLERIECTVCGKENTELNSFCWNCGNLIDKELASAVAAGKFNEREQIKNLHEKIQFLEQENENLLDQVKQVKLGYQKMEEKLTQILKSQVSHK